jgi:hypothetical protein
VGNLFPGHGIFVTSGNTSFENIYDVHFWKFVYITIIFKFYCSDGTYHFWEVHKHHIQTLLFGRNLSLLGECISILSKNCLFGRNLSLLGSA